LEYSRKYRLTVSQGLLSIYSNRMAFAWSLPFRTENLFSVKWSNPHWSGFCTDFGSRERIELHFSNPLDPACDYSLYMQLRLGTNGTPVSGSWKVEYDNLRWTSDSPFTVGAVYELTVDPDLPDRNGRTLTNASGLKIYFRVAAYPVLRDATPHEDDHGFPPWVPLRFRFSGPMQQSGWSVSCEGKDWSSGSWEEEGSVLRIFPQASQRLPYREPGTDTPVYSLNLNGFKDSAGALLHNTSVKSILFRTLPRFVEPPSWSGMNPQGSTSHGFAASARDRQLYLVSVNGSQLQVFQYSEEYHQWGNEPEYGFSGFWSQLRSDWGRSAPLTVLADGDGAFWGSKDASGNYIIESHNRSLAPPVVPLTNVYAAEMGRDGNGTPVLAVLFSYNSGSQYAVRILRYANGRFADLPVIPLGNLAPLSVAVGRDSVGNLLVVVCQNLEIRRFSFISGAWNAASVHSLFVAPIGRIRLETLVSKTYLNVPGERAYEVTSASLVPVVSAFSPREDIGVFLGKLYGVRDSGHYLHHLDGSDVKSGFPHAPGDRVTYDNGANVRIVASARRLTVLYTKDDQTLGIQQHVAPPQ
jgi:hypothetical protein